MEEHQIDPVSSRLEGSSNIPKLNLPKIVWGGIWGNPTASGSSRASSDASLFSSSLPVLSHKKLNSTEEDGIQKSFDDGLPPSSKLLKEDEGNDSFEDFEPHMVGNSLPDDEDELLAGIMDDFDLSDLPSKIEDLDDDIFRSGGGLELDFDPLGQGNMNIGLGKLNVSDAFAGNGIIQYGLPNGVPTVAGEHPYGEHPSRTLFVRNINSNVEDSELKALFEQYGDIRTLYTACKHRGFVMISYYDIRDARTAMRALQNKPLRRRKLDIHFSIPKDNPSEKDMNQGTLVIFNLDASVLNDDLRNIFGAYGEVKEIRETPHKRHHKFIEFYDVRAAEAALKALNRSDIAGKRIKLEPSRPGGARRNLMQQINQELEQDDCQGFRHHLGSPPVVPPALGNWLQFSSPVEHNTLQSFSRSPGMGSMSPVDNNRLPGLAAILPSHTSSSPKIAPIGKVHGGINSLNPGFADSKSTESAAYQWSLSHPDHKLNTRSGLVSSFGESTSSGIETLSGPQFLWGSPSPYSEYTGSSTWSSSSLGHPFTPSGQRHNISYPSAYGSLLGLRHHHHHVGSAPSGIPLDRHFGYFPESPDASFMNPVTLGEYGLSPNKGNHIMNVGSRGTMSKNVGFVGNMSEKGSPNVIMSSPRHSPLYLPNGVFPGFGAVNNGALGERQRVEINVIQMESKKYYQLHLEKISSGEDTRTTLMIKNIPNKYTSKMLLTAIDENHRGTYDFIYLPIDFKNKCNVGYAFINMVSPSHIISFYQEFNGKRWEKFNSEKVASLAYARIQGKAALVTHFQNSSLMNEDKRCRPILFHSEGEDTDEQDSLPTGNLNICIRQPDGSYSGDSLDSPKDNQE